MYFARLYLLYCEIKLSRMRDFLQKSRLFQPRQLHFALIIFRTISSNLNDDIICLSIPYLHGIMPSTRHECEREGKPRPAVSRIARCW